MSTNSPLPVPNNARNLAAHLKSHGLPGQRSSTEITRLRRQRAGRRRVEPPAASIQDRLNMRLLTRARNEIKRRGGETAIETKNTSIPLSIWDRDQDQKILLVGAVGWRYYSRREGSHYATLAYLTGVDDNGTWAVRTPGTIRTVYEAMAWLTPAPVANARATGRRVLRQGDVYAVETSNRNDGAGAYALPQHHKWNRDTRLLTHNPDDGRQHQALHVPFPVQFVRQRVYEMGRGGGRGYGD